jgi:hypothetical protein
MKKYIVKLVFTVSVDSKVKEFDEQLRLISALDEEAAFLKARMLGKKEEETFFDREGALVSWRFVDVMQITALDGTADGSLICSESKSKETESYISYVRDKAMEIQVKNVTFA